MKKINILLILGAIFLSLNTMAQDSKILAGVRLNYASDIESLGITAEGTYLINDTWEAGAGFTYFLPSDNGVWGDWNYSALDVDAHYVLVDDAVKVYALAGINMTFLSYDFSYESYDYNYITGEMYTTTVEDSYSDSYIGFNVGAGIRYPLSDKLSLKGLAKYTIGDVDYITFGAGVLYHF